MICRATIWPPARVHLYVKMWRECQVSHSFYSFIFHISHTIFYATYTELICVKKISTGRKGKQTQECEDVAMMEETEYDMADTALGSEHATGQWSLYQVLASMGERLLNTHVNSRFCSVIHTYT